MKWYPFQKEKRTDEEAVNPTQVGLLNQAVEERSPIDDDDDSHYRKESEDSEGKFYSNKITPTSLQRVQADRYVGNNEINTIEILDPKKPKPIVPRVAMQAVNRSLTDSVERCASPIVPIMMEFDVGDRPPPPYTTVISSTTTTVLSLPRSERW